jgi:hypothetical protein
MIVAKCDLLGARNAALAPLERTHGCASALSNPPQRPRYVLVVVRVVEAGEPGRQPLNLYLEVGKQIDERAQLIGDPSQRDRLVAASCFELLDPAIGEVHASLRERRGEQQVVLALAAHM